MSSPPATNSLVQRLDALYEYDREPVTEKDLHGWKIFWATFAGEHIAGTEFVLGPLFVLHGATAAAVFGGLLFGNLLAVLSWALVCAPIAVKTRLTTYWEIRQLGGPWLTVIYSSLYALIFCVLAGAMVNVSTTAVAIPFDIRMTSVGSSLPTLGWVVLAVAVGSLIAVLAVVGFEGMAIFSKMSAPWLVAVFIAAAIATLPQLGCHSIGDFWRVANERIWTGRAAPGYTHYSFWHIAGFAWLCNVSQHIGMADLTILRFARKWQMGFTSAAGMYLGHFGAWIASGILCAAAISAGVVTYENISPGIIAYLGAGFTGAFCVVVAGWNTASPTLYRSGLALQVATPNWKRWKVTLAVGTAMTICACIPNLLGNLDRLVGYYGLLFLPLGAFILADHAIFPRLGLEAGRAMRVGSSLAWPAMLAWVGSLGFSLFIYGKDNYPGLQHLLAGHLPTCLVQYKADLFFLVLPEWIVAILLYIAFSLIEQRALSRSAEVALNSAAKP